MGEQAQATEAVGHRPARHRGQLAQRGDAQALELGRQGGELLAVAQQRDGLARQVARARDEAGPPRLRPRRAATIAQKRDGPAPRRTAGWVGSVSRSARGASRTGDESAARVAASTPSSEPPCRRRSPRASKQASPGRPGSTRAPIASRRSSTRSQASATPSGSGGTSVRRGQRASASPIRMPAWMPKPSAACETSPTFCSRPGSGARAAGPLSTPARPPAATTSSKRGTSTQTIDDTNTCSHAIRSPARSRPRPERT